jgi:arylsulfatase A-like enzyme
MNTIFILVDTIRRDHLGCYGNDWIQSPAFDQLSAEAVTFDNAYLGSYPCMPARREIWTGRYEFPWRGWGPLEHDDPDLAMLMTQHDKTSMVVSDHFHMWEKGSGNYFFGFSGIEFIRGQENDMWITDPTIEIDYPIPAERLAGHAKPGSFDRYKRNTAHFKTESDWFAPRVFNTAMDWLESNRTHEDFFLLIECFDPHEPFDPPHPYNRLYNPGYDGADIIWPSYGWSDDLSADELKNIRSLYAGELTHTDKWLGRFLDKVRELGLMDDTMIILTTDHGHMFGEHGIMGKPWTDLSDSNMYQELVHIPLMIYHPEQSAAGKRIDHLVQPVDFYATMLANAGVPIPDGTNGHSLLPMIRASDNGSALRETAPFARYGEAINITDGDWSLFLWPDGESNDPLYWYSTLPPQFGAIQTTGAYDGVAGRYPVAVTRGQMPSALFNLKDDYAQANNVIDQHPDVAARLKGQLRGFLESVGAPEEQFQRVGL